MIKYEISQIVSRHLYCFKSLSIYYKLHLKYDRLCRESNGIDFDDLLGLTVALLQTVPQVRQELQRRWQHILVDEFQVGS